MFNVFKNRNVITRLISLMCNVGQRLYRAFSLHSSVCQSPFSFTPSLGYLFAVCSFVIIAELDFRTGGAVTAPDISHYIFFIQGTLRRKQRTVPRRAYSLFLIGRR